MPLVASCFVTAWLQPGGVIAEKTLGVASIDSLPTDLPLPASPPLRDNWLRSANVLQPYGHSAFIALTDIKDRPERLKKEFGFNTIIVQPPDSHNTIVGPTDKLTEEQFRTGLAAYRRAGYRIMLYTSLMALGLSPEFQSGLIAREHPDWLQRDAKGNHVMVWGVPWLCPNTGARGAALERCLRIAREYDADGIMLDNNQFFSAADGWTCHCNGCGNAFRKYIGKRFSDKQSLQLFGTTPETLTIPTQEGPLFFLWLHWRNRVWAEINESFRSQLRNQNPNIMLFANTQYLFENGMLASDFQFEREDVVLSESCNLTSRQASEKMLLGKALAAGRPLWNYIGTFAKPDDYTGMLSPDTVGPAIAATLAHNARPWIVDGFDEGPTDAESRKLMSTLLSWHALHQNLFDGTQNSSVATIISTQSRNILRRPLIPPHATVLQAAGASPIFLRGEALDANAIRRLKLITIETAACLPHESARRLATWVREGGTLVAAPDIGTYDELGRKHPGSLLFQELTILPTPSLEPHAVGRGRVIIPQAEAFATVSAQLAKPYCFNTSEDSGAEIVTYRSNSSLLFHIVRHEKLGEPLTVVLHQDLVRSADARVYIPGNDSPQSLALDSTSGGTSFTIPNAPLYCVVEVRHK